MKTRTKIALLAAGLALAGHASAQESLLEHVVNACEADLKQYCSQVTPGEGRMLHCVAAHEDKLSGQCEYALYEAASLLQQLSTAIVYVAESCQTEIQTLCSDVKVGEGRILTCLEENDASIGETCRQAISDTVGE
ncbi:MAG: cysteine rich repeat-containing protein [Woeseiaceae bacterium]|nr:cysteine rich repeat-containing protein [Woeseiaceae bacterium]